MKTARILACLLTVFLSAPAAQSDDWVLGLEELYRIDRLPAFKRSLEVGSMSSYDRSGGNNDGFSGQYSFIRKEADGLVLLDLAGPGILYRIWTPTPTDDPIEFYFDGEPSPRIRVPFRDIFTGRSEPFVRPLVGFGAGGFYSYVPIPFAKSCKIVARAERLQFYQINYAIYPDGTPVKTFVEEPTAKYLQHRQKASELFAANGTDVSNYGAIKSDALTTHRVHKSLAPGESCTIFETQQPGRIVGLRLTPATAFSGKDRALLLRATWDDDPQPAILAPVGDLFGHAWGEPAMQSLLVGTAGNVNYLYFPMPFERSAKIELISERSSGVPVEFDAEVVVDPSPRSPDEGRFYAHWRRENPTTKGRPFTFIETTGRGHLVGCVQQSQGLESGNTYYFEGDDQTTIDGKLVIHGTGSEDFYNGGWYDVPGRWETRRSFPLSGCLAYQKHLARTGGYRLMLGDAYAYRESILQTIEHAPNENRLLNDYCGVTYLYSDERPTCSFDLPAVSDRRVVDLKRLIFSVWWNVPIHAWSFQYASLKRLHKKMGDEDVRLLSLEATGQDMFGPPFIAFVCELPAAGRYRVSIEAAQGPQQGSVQLFMDEAAVGDAIDLHAATRDLSPPLRLGTLELEEGPNTILLKIVGKHADAKSLRIDLRSIICERED